MKRSLLLGYLAVVCFSLIAQPSPKALDHDVYDDWQLLARPQLSPQGNRITYEINVQRGDGTLFVKDGQGESLSQLERGTKAAISGDGQLIVAHIKAPWDSTMKAKRAKKKGDKLPTDSLAVWVEGWAGWQKTPDLKSVQIPAKKGNWVAYMLTKTPKDTAKTDSAAKEATPPKEAEAEAEKKAEEPEKEKKPKGKKKKRKSDLPKTFPFRIWEPGEGEPMAYEKVYAYQWSEQGMHLAFMQAFGDSADSVRVLVFTTESQQVDTIYTSLGYAEKPVFSKDEQQLAFVATTDTGKVRGYMLEHWAVGQEQSQALAGPGTPGMKTGWAVSQHRKPEFSEKGLRLFFGTAPLPPAPIKDTLAAEEKARLDVWNWQDGRLQPHQLKQKAQDLKRNYRAVWHMADARMLQLGDAEVRNLSLSGKGDGRYAMGADDRAYEKMKSWTSPWPRDVYVVNVETGERTRVLEAQGFSHRLSPGGTHLIWYDGTARDWHSYSMATGEKRSLTKKLKVNFYREEHDSPQEPYPYGLAGFMTGDQYVLIRDRYDIWRVDMEGNEKPFNLTRGQGRKLKIRFSPQDLDREDPYVDMPTMLLKGFDEQTKAEAFYRIDPTAKDKARRLMGSDHHYSGILKARDAASLLWRKESFTEDEDLWMSGLDGEKPVQLTHLNPQRSEYRWGKVELVHWKAYDGQDMEGLLYTPDDLDPNRKYPMVVYFYERRSDGLHTHRIPSPSRSTINPSIYTSNEYVYFVPNIHYKTGQPGEDAYNAIVSGTEAMMRQYSFVDSTRMALQGQSWGGYQVAYLVTKTNLYRAAMAGAPVSNMTSAYGGIRWGSGLSRMFQYEKTQSRLGTTLWEDPDRYIKNSPLFFAPQVETPLLMMHNDADGAVPWYQGIEFFTALRRLEKPVWMLVYNDEAHNLTRWPNRVDLGIRMKQFFDHYLKDAPAPVWMTKGVPAVDKGRETGYELENPADTRDE